MLALLTSAAGSFYAGAPLPASAARMSSPMMGSAEAVAQKGAIVEEVKGQMEDALLMFCVRSEGITVNDMNMMRQKFPEDVTIRCVKNTLVKRAAEDYPRFQGGDDLLVKSNYWFFVPEDRMRETVDTWNDWVDETKKVRGHAHTSGGSVGGRQAELSGRASASCSTLRSPSCSPAFS